MSAAAPQPFGRGGVRPDRKVQLTFEYKRISPYEGKSQLAPAMVPQKKFWWRSDEDEAPVKPGRRTARTKKNPVRMRGELHTSRQLHRENHRLVEKITHISSKSRGLYPTNFLLAQNRLLRKAGREAQMQHQRRIEKGNKRLVRRLTEISRTIPTGLGRGRGVRTGRLQGQKVALETARRRRQERVDRENRRLEARLKSIKHSTASRSMTRRLPSFPASGHEDTRGPSSLSGRRHLPLDSPSLYMERKVLVVPRPAGAINRHTASSRARSEPNPHLHPQYHTVLDAHFQAVSARRQGSNGPAVPDDAELFSEDEQAPALSRDGSSRAASRAGSSRAVSAESAREGGLSPTLQQIITGAEAVAMRAYRDCNVEEGQLDMDVVHILHAPGEPQSSEGVPGDDLRAEMEEVGLVDMSLKRFDPNAQSPASPTSTAYPQKSKEAGADSVTSTRGLASLKRALQGSIAGKGTGAAPPSTGGGRLARALKSKSDAAKRDDKDDSQYWYELPTLAHVTLRSIHEHFRLEKEVLMEKQRNVSSGRRSNASAVRGSLARDGTVSTDGSLESSPNVSNRSSPNPRLRSMGNPM